LAPERTSKILELEQLKEISLLPFFSLEDVPCGYSCSKKYVISNIRLLLKSAIRESLQGERIVCTSRQFVAENILEKLVGKGKIGYELSTSSCEDAS